MGEVPVITSTYIGVSQQKKIEHCDATFQIEKCRFKFNFECGKSQKWHTQRNNSSSNIFAPH